MESKKIYTRRKAIGQLLAAGAMTTLLPCQGFSLNDHGQSDSTTVLFQGDSITDGNRSRNNDWNHVMGHGYAYLIASRLWYDHPRKGFHFFNRGISGNKVADLAERWQTDTIEIKPDLLSILVGVNDLNSLFNPNDPNPVKAPVFEEQYQALLQRTKEQLPSTRIVICEPFLLPVGKVKENWTAWSTEMKTRQDIVKRLATASGCLFIPLQDAFDKACEKAPADYWIWDGIHPMPAGHELIARRWLHTVGKI